MKDKIYLSLAHMGGEEMAYIQEAFDSNWVVPLGPNVNGFEKDLSSFLGKGPVVALNSGTSAIHLALILLGVKQGDEVICQSFTFVATANPVKYLGAKLIFVDSEPDTWNMDPILLEKTLKDRFKQTGRYPKAIIPVHLYGMPAKIDEILEVAARYDIPVLEDSAEALGSKMNGQFCGTFGQFGVISFNGNKIITTSGGGALICQNEAQAEKTRFYATQAKDNFSYYHHTNIGYNYRLSNVCAGIGRGQMKVLDEHVSKRRKLHDQYKVLLDGIKGLYVKDNPSSAFESNFWLTCILVDSNKAGFTAEDLRRALEAEKIESRTLWKPMHLQPIFAGEYYAANGLSEKYFRNGLCLPSGYDITEEDLIRITNIIKYLSVKTNHFFAVSV
jgi:dTDP-4-amino-4,6-dideoxygalactose transaminase